ncbi:helix-turn-helix transcriptional regulator [uncultured Bacteroides sp.]|uniref:helix-turn-helix domain-containing protein n=1 Tax=uncultured Bacteroides sp. TaxID=162156 RepID=UPI0025D13BF4|nr:helix-turn-helix transcriptional regulator [uncultured Bacteroides sp.]
MELQADVRLTKRENQIAGLAFCGLAKKEMADRLKVAYGTINVLLDKAYKKTGTSKLNELAAWWANRAYALNIDFQQLQRTIIALCFLALVVFQIFTDQDDYCRIRRGKTARRYKTEEIFNPNNNLAA